MTIEPLTITSVRLLLILIFYHAWPQRWYTKCMIVLALFSWWYSEGWTKLARKVDERTDAVLGFFSVGTLFATLFAPFRQISAGHVQGAPGMQMRAFFDRLFSRFFGAFLRGIMIVVGLVLALLSGLLGVAQLIIWPLVPLMPIVGLVLTSKGLLL